MLTVHGRTKEEKKDKTANVNYDAIKRIKEALHIPVIANGGVASKEDADMIMAYTGVDGIMTSEAILENPALFGVDKLNPKTKKPLTQFDVIEEYLDLAEEHTDLEVCGTKGRSHVLKMVRAHLFKLMHYDFQVQLLAHLKEI